MKLTVLGNNGPFPAKDGACSGYVVENNKDCRSGNKTLDSKGLVILDLGSGCLANFQKKFDIEDISFVVITHLHFDHMSDLLVLRYALQVKGRKMDIYLPKEPENVASILKCDEFNLIYIDESSVIERDSFILNFKQTTHPVETYAVKINNHFVYSSDLAQPEDLKDFACGVDTLLIDSALLAKQKSKTNAAHLCAKECGMLAAELNVKRLILTHFPPYSDLRQYLMEASTYFANTVTAEILQEY
ncbi:MAG TPA: MBL fold metallo-hydrolase [Clostridia bacterium]|jgi:ribonuclease BN (tRNA processing enzyme)|nr:MBL fold metallo-hydrolase [Clostridiaceae bacterium]HOF26968.1 MBL fold metallo-hydrolase [Clostridia bacterium]HOM35208.1 MBL fold metallo-hydrolase [Clostridia bacterium]HOT70162.1 MBL fold metallo-hydrolase [Clostridia bacterium]HPL08538.1 MBL fold metallo-hydrolase [Clostridia bacterium]